MCGLTGFVSFTSSDVTYLHSSINEMLNTLYHRGPDSQGLWVDVNQGLAFGHCRLAIQDLTNTGHQPMTSNSNRFVMVFNGEIYNHLNLRKEIEREGYLTQSTWRGHSDTETILAGFDAWGIEATVDKMIGMFAIALWDRKKHQLTLMRDRLGEKPLYYGWQNDTFLFCSELKALKKHDDFESEIDRDSLALYLRYNTIPAPYSIYKGIYKLKPGQILTLDSSKNIKKDCYWTVSDVSVNDQHQPFKGTTKEAIRGLENTLLTSIDNQMISDVQLGAFLSGGVDSSTIVALMQSISNKPIKTFTIGFDATEFNEAIYAKKVAKHLKTDHTEVYLGDKSALDIIPNIFNIYDEPFADSSQLPTILLSQIAKKEVTVSLSGDGGDELFAGYTRHQKIHSLWPKLSKIPKTFRQLGASLLSSIPYHRWQQIQGFLPKAYNIPLLGDKVKKTASMLAANSLDSAYLSLVSQCETPENWVLNSKEPPNFIKANFNQLSNLTDVEIVMVLDTMFYLSDDILVKVDRAAMSQSLEVRVPFLDHNVVEYAWRLPLHFKLHEDSSKWVLREVLKRYVPMSLIDRPKMGFAAPIGHWLRYDLKDWAETLIDEYRLSNEGFFNVTLVRQLWREHLSGKFNHQYQLWTILMFQLWLENEKD